MTGPLPEIVFLYRGGHRNSGAKLMRCDQLSGFARAHLGDRYQFRTGDLPNPKHIRRQQRLVEELKGAIVIFLKRADRALDPDVLGDLRGAVRGMGIDYVDGNMWPLPTVPMDVHIAASIHGLRALEVLLSGPFEALHNSRTTARLVLHHADPRIVPLPEGGGRDLSLSYFGRADNAFLPEPVIAELSDLPDYADADVDDAFLKLVAQSNMHYCVREIGTRNRRLSFKPFTKGFNAAAAGANVIVNRQVPDAEALLGEDYPYLIDGARVEDVLAGIARARAEVGSEVWQRGLEAMRALRHRISVGQIVRQLDSALQVMV